MKNYKERTQAVLDKIDERSGEKQTAVENGGGTLSVKRDKTIKRVSLLAVFLAFLIAINLLLFIPFPTYKANLSAYKDSEYYGLMTVVSKLTQEKPRYKNNFEKMMSAFSGCGASYDNAEAPPPSSGSDLATTPEGSNGNYVENTNNQVKTVTEGDLLKCSDKYAFYLLPQNGDSLKLSVYGLNGESSGFVSSYSISNSYPSYYKNNCEMYLSKDCNTVFVITPEYDKNNALLYTSLISLDVSDVRNIKENGRINVSGSYISSRSKDGTLLLFTNFYVYRKPDFSVGQQFLPSAGAPDDMKVLPAEDIIYSENATSARYTVVCSVDESTLEITSNYAFLSFSENAYVSENNIFLTRTYTEDNKDGGLTYENHTEINCLHYADGGLEYKDKAIVAGTVLNQYSMDERDGILRVVTDVNCSGKNYSYRGASLYCVDLESFEMRASLERFSPNGEEVYSVRFDGTTAYVCTAEVKVILTDPVFAIDLSDLDDITFKDTGTITGYSSSMMKFKDDTLLGIGYGEVRNMLKIELYRETDDGVESVDSFEKVCNFSNEFKAYFINAENGLIGLGVSDYIYAKDEYLLFLFDGYKLNLVETVEFEKFCSLNYDYPRAVLIDGYIYLFSHEGLNVISWNAE